MARFGTLSARQQAAVQALLTQPSVISAAQAARVSGRTMFRWLADPDFAERYRQARREAVSRAIARLQRAAESAVSTLQAIMEDSDAPVSSRLSSAKIVLELALRGAEIEDLEARLERLEQTTR